MSKHLQREIDKLKKMILSLCADVEDCVRKAVRSVSEGKAEPAEEIIKNDIEIDHMEVEVEEECLKILALHQPVAIDLRFIIAVLKINNDLERIADLAADIAERAVYLSKHEKIEVPFDLAGLSAKVQLMLKQSLDALVNLDTQLAYRVCVSDDEVDEIHKGMYERIQESIRKKPENIPVLIPLLSVSKHLERIADHATNIAEDVIYMVEGEIVRHKTEEHMQDSV